MVQGAGEFQSKRSDHASNITQQILQSKALTLFLPSSCSPRGGRVAVKGWKENTSADAVELAQRCERDGASWIIYTDISRDGTGRGVDTEETLRVARSVEIPVIASGGVASLDDIRRLKEIETEGIEGVIIGRALYSGAFTLPEAMEAGGG